MPLKFEFNRIEEVITCDDDQCEKYFYHTCIKTHRILHHLLAGLSETNRHQLELCIAHSDLGILLRKAIETDNVELIDFLVEFSVNSGRLRKFASPTLMNNTLLGMAVNYQADNAVIDKILMSISDVCRPGLIKKLDVVARL